MKNLWKWLAILVVAGAIHAAIHVGVLNLEQEDTKPPLPIGYTLYDLTSQRVIDVQPCPHSWAVGPSWYSGDQYIPGLDRTFEFGYGVVLTTQVIWVELQPKGYKAPSSCGPAYAGQ